MSNHNSKHETCNAMLFGNLIVQPMSWSYVLVQLISSSMLNVYPHLSASCLCIFKSVLPSLLVDSSVFICIPVFGLRSLSVIPKP